MKRRAVRWAPSAASDLEEIVQFIHADRPAAATAVARQIDTAVRGLGRNPLRGPVIPELLELGVTEFR